MIRMVFAALLLAAPVGASAHEAWIEREGNAVRVLVGDATGERDSGEAIAKLVNTARLRIGDSGAPVPLRAEANHLAAAVSGPGDVRFYADQIWAPWKRDDGTWVAAAFQARSGRTETRAIHDLELVPVAAGSDQVTLVFKGTPLAGTEVTVITPDLWQKNFRTDTDGCLAVPVGDKGRYILVARHEAPADVAIAGQAVARLQHIASLSFIAE